MSPTHTRIVSLLETLRDNERRTRQVVDAFREFDADGSGALEEEEFAKGLKSLGSFSDLSRAEVKAFFRHRDADGSGTLEIEELYALLGTRLRRQWRRAIFQSSVEGECGVQNAFGLWDDRECSLE